MTCKDYVEQMLVWMKKMLTDLSCQNGEAAVAQHEYISHIHKETIVPNNVTEPRLERTRTDCEDDQSARLRNTPRQCTKSGLAICTRA